MVLTSLGRGAFVNEILVVDFIQSRPLLLGFLQGRLMLYLGLLRGLASLECTHPRPPL